MSVCFLAVPACALAAGGVNASEMVMLPCKMQSCSSLLSPAAVLLCCMASTASSKL